MTVVNAVIVDAARESAFRVPTNPENASKPAATRNTGSCEAAAADTGVTIIRN
jgi:hypothetical protein